MSFSDDLEIDKHGLDDELLDQARRYEKYSRIWGGLDAQFSAAEARVKYEKAKLAQEIRVNWKEYFDHKPNNDMVKEFVDSDPSIYRLIEKMHDLKTELNAADAVKWSFQQRKDMLENLVKLHLSGYWAEPYTGNSESLESDRMEKRKQRRDSDA